MEIYWKYLGHTYIYIYIHTHIQRLKTLFVIGTLFLSKNLVLTQNVRLFDQTHGFYAECRTYIKILRATGLHGGQHINTLIFQKHERLIRLWGHNP